MSADKGGALVRSPPSIYSHQGVGWGGPNSSLSSSHTHRQPIRATVKKLPSGDANKVNKYEFTNMDRKNQAQELEQSCSCGGWSKAKQLGHDLIQLRVHHEAILKGLFEEVDELKRKNSDLTLTLLMGPISAQFKTDAPSITDAQNIPKNEANSPVFEKVLSNLNGLTLSGKPIDRSRKMANGKSADKGRYTDQDMLDPIKTHSATIEMLEEETNEAKRQLEEEKRKNQYLWRVVDELKRQVAAAKKDDNGNNFKNVPTRKFDKGRSTPSNQSVKALYLPALVDKQGNKQMAHKQMSTSFSYVKSSNESNNGLKNSMFRNSCPTLPSINSSNDSFSRYEPKGDDIQKLTEIDYHTAANQTTITNRLEGSYKTNFPIRAKRSSKKDRHNSEERQTSTDSRLLQKYDTALKNEDGFKTSPNKLEERVHVDTIGNEYKVDISSNEKKAKTTEHAWNKSTDADPSTEEEGTTVESLTLGNSISIADMPNTTLTSQELLSVRPKTKSKGRRSGRNKKRKNGPPKNDIDI